MCRMAAYLGVPAPLSTLFDAPHGLTRQAWDPREQLAGNVNVDGTGVVWWRDGDPQPLRYVSPGPPWSDPNLLGLAPRLRAYLQVAAVRSATPGIPVAPGAVAPFVRDGIAAAHNGWIDGYRSLSTTLLGSLPDDLAVSYDAVSDSLAIVLTVVAHVRREGDLASGVEAALRDLEAACAAADRAASLNLVVSDGRGVVAVRHAVGTEANSLYTLTGSARWDGASLVASEPLDDGAGWQAVPARHLVEVRDGEIVTRPLQAPRVRITRVSLPRSVREQLAEDVRTGFAVPGRRSLPPKYFYDARGSRLFEAITRLPEYYLTRAEVEILQVSARGVVAETAPEELVELGSGSSRKTDLLLDALHEVGSGDRYVSLDVSEAALRDAAARLASTHPWVRVEGIVGDFTCDLAAVPRQGRRLLAFLGSTVGNFESDERAVFFKQVAASLGPGDRFLLGVDLVKGTDVLEAAYDDAAGVTAAFNRNLLSVLNHELDGDLPEEAFEHVARFDPDRSCIDMFLRATREVTATFAALPLRVRFTAGEELHTEVSAKFTRRQVAQELAAAGMHLTGWYLDTGRRFALACAAPGPAGSA